MITCYIDTETSGLFPGKYQVLTAALKIVNGQRCVTREFEFGLLESSAIDDKALEINGLTREQIKKFPPCQYTYRELTSFLGQFVNPYDKADKMTFAGYNARFDYDHMRSLFERLGDRYFGSWFWFPPLDIMNTAFDALRDRRKDMKDFKLATVAKTLGIELKKEELHDALYDIELSIEVYKSSIKIIKERKDA